jgi:outer membrane receptor for ferrienterochelin and colicins
MSTISSQSLVLRIMFCAFILVSCIEHVVYAQEKSANQAPTKSDQEQKVEINAKQYDARREDTVTKLVVTEEEIKQYGESNIAEILRRQLGITVNGNEIRMRGLANGYTQILIEGEPLPRGMTLDSINVNQIKRIEIIRSATADLSTQAIGGTINVVMKKVEVASRDLVMSLNQSAVNSFRNINFLQSDKSEQFSYSVSGRIFIGYFSQNGWRELIDQDGLGNPYLTQNARFKSKTSFPGFQIEPRFTWTLDGGDVLSFKTFILNQKITQNNSTDWLTLLDKFNQISQRSVDQSNDDYDTKTFDNSLNWESHLNDESKLNLMLSSHFYNKEMLGSDRSLNQYSNLQLARQTQVNEKHQHWKSTGSYTSPIAKTHTFKSGWDIGFASLDSQRMQQDTLLVASEKSKENIKAQTNRLAIYAQDEWQTTPTWSNYFGVRWESFKTLATGSNFARVDNSIGVLSPILQTLWKLPKSKENQMRMALSRTFKNPDLYDFIPNEFQNFHNQAALPYMVGNPNLKPELALGWDASYEHFGENSLNYSASFYVKKIQNLIRRDISFINQRWVDMPVNDGDAQTHGIELDTKFPLSVFIESMKHIELRANVSRNWSTVDNVPAPNNRFAEQARLSANVGVDYKANDQWSSGASYTFASGGHFQLSPESSRYNGVRRTVDTFVKWKLNKETTVRFVVRNLLAQDGIRLNRYADGNGATVNQEVLPSYRQLGLTLELKL